MERAHTPEPEDEEGSLLGWGTPIAQLIDEAKRMGSRQPNLGSSAAEERAERQRRAEKGLDTPGGDAGRQGSCGALPQFYAGEPMNVDCTDGEADKESVGDLSDGNSANVGTPQRSTCPSSGNADSPSSPEPPLLGADQRDDDEVGRFDEEAHEELSADDEESSTVINHRLKLVAGKLETERGFGSEGEHEMQAEGGGDDDEGVEPAKKKQKGL